MVTALWVDKYAPKHLEEMIGQREAVEFITQWAQSWKDGVKQKPLLLHGGTGTGKTTAALLAAKDFDFDILELNASDVRNADNVNRIAGLASVSTTFSGKKRLILFDEIEGLFGSEDRGGAGAILKIIKEAECPMILTANDVWDQKLASIRMACEQIKFRKVDKRQIKKFLIDVAELENKAVPLSIIEFIADHSSGDLRSAINDLQMISAAEIKDEKEVSLITSRDREQDIFESMRIVLKTMSFEESRRAISHLDEDPDFVLKWIDENVSKEYRDINDLYRAHEMISRADIFLGRVNRRNNYGFWAYASDLMSAGVSLAKEHSYHDFNHYGFPSLIKGLSSSKGERAMRKQIASKIAKKVHVSTSTAIVDYLPMFEELMKSQAAELALQFEFDEDELEFFSVLAPKKVIEQSHELKVKAVADEKSLKKDEKQKGLGSFF